jgi:hypothetical protein
MFSLAWLNAMRAFRRYDEEGKKKGIAPVTAPVYPAVKPLNYALLPPLDLAPGEATKKMMATGCNPLPKYAL